MLFELQNGFCSGPVRPVSYPENGMESAVIGRMSLNRLLSFVPFAHRLGPVLDRRTSAVEFLVFVSLNLLMAVWGLMILVSVFVLSIFAWHTSGVALFGTPGARDAEIDSINSVTDVGLLQHKAALDVSEAYANGATATYLCHLALGTLLLIILVSIGSLFLLRWVKGQLRTGAEEIE